MFAILKETKIKEQWTSDKIKTKKVF